MRPSTIIDRLLSLPNFISQLGWLTDPAWNQTLFTLIVNISADRYATEPMLENKSSVENLFLVKV